MNDTQNQIPEPDPAWDYYVTWHKLYKAKFHLDKLIQEIAPLEYASINVDESINNDLDKIIGILSDTYIEIEETETPDEPIG